MLAPDERCDCGQVWKIDPVTHARVALSATTDKSQAHMERGLLRDPDGRIVLVIGAP